MFHIASKKGKNQFFKHLFQLKIIYVFVDDSDGLSINTLVCNYALVS